MGEDKGVNINMNRNNLETQRVVGIVAASIFAVVMVNYSPKPKLLKQSANPDGFDKDKTKWKDEGLAGADDNWTLAQVTLIHAKDDTNQIDEAGAGKGKTVTMGNIKRQGVAVWNGADPEIAVTTNIVETKILPKIAIEKKTFVQKSYLTVISAITAIAGLLLIAVGYFFLRVPEIR